MAGDISQGSNLTIYRLPILPGDGERVIPTTSALVLNGRIARVAPSSSAPEWTAVVDGSGKTLLPGLIDSHTHTWGTALRDAAALGVTTVLDMFTDPETAADFRKLDGTAAGRETADFRSAGVLVTAPKGHGTEYGMAIPTITSPGEAHDAGPHAAHVVRSGRCLRRGRALPMADPGDCDADHNLRSQHKDAANVTAKETTSSHSCGMNLALR